jgi:hypothetical protein
MRIDTQQVGAGGRGSWWRRSWRAAERRPDNGSCGIARDEYLSALLHKECERRGIVIVYAKMPSDDPLTSVVMLNTMRGFDRYHRMASRMKALAGMSENVRQGY